MAAVVVAAQAVALLVLLVLLAGLQGSQGSLHDVRPQSAQVRCGDEHCLTARAAARRSPTASRPLNWLSPRIIAPLAAVLRCRSRAMAGARH